VNFSAEDKKLLAISFGVALLMPYLSRVPGALDLGSWWITSYAPSFGAVMFFAVVNSIPGVMLFMSAKIHPKSRVPFGCAVAAAIIAIYTLHNNLDLSSDSTAAVALVIFPILTLVPIAVGWLVGWAWLNIWFSK